MPAALGLGLLQAGLMRCNRRQMLVLATAGMCKAAPRPLELRPLEEQWKEIARQTDGTVGAAALHLESGERISLHGDERFPLASVCKAPIAMNILAMVDEGKLTLDQQIEILPRDVWHGVSEIAQRWPGERRFPVEEMVRLMVARSDNTAVETLFRVGGGAAAMAARFREWKVDGVRVDRSERQCDLERNGVQNYPPAAEWDEPVLDALVTRMPAEARYRATLAYLRDPRDTGTPNGTVHLLARLFQGQAVSKSSTARLIGIMKSTTTGAARLKGLLPPGTVVAHKTGSTGTVNGLTAATNDSGVIFAPRGGRIAVSVYAKASTRDDAVRDRLIPRIARAAFDRWEKRID